MKARSSGMQKKYRDLLFSNVLCVVHVGTRLNPLGPHRRFATTPQQNMSNRATCTSTEPTGTHALTRVLVDTS